MRLNKFISETGICSRREADALIEAGRVSINGAVAVLGTQVESSDTVSIDGKPVGEWSELAAGYAAARAPVRVEIQRGPAPEGERLVLSPWSSAWLDAAPA